MDQFEILQRVLRSFAGSMEEPTSALELYMALVAGVSPPYLIQRLEY